MKIKKEAIKLGTFPAGSYVFICKNVYSQRNGNIASSMQLENLQRAKVSAACVQLFKTDLTGLGHSVEVLQLALHCSCGQASCVVVALGHWVGRSDCWLNHAGKLHPRVEIERQRLMSRFFWEV